MDGGIEIVCDLIGLAVGTACPHFWHGIGFLSGGIQIKYGYIISDFLKNVKVVGGICREFLYNYLTVYFFML